MLAGVTAASTLVPGGYRIELRVPANLIPGGLAPGRVLGFDVSYIDVDTSDRYTHAVQFRWTGSNWSFFSTQDFARMTVAGP